MTSLIFTSSERKIAFTASFAVVLSLLGAAESRGASPEPAMLVDRIVAAVDDDPIYLSDLRRVIALGLDELRGEETASELERRVLDALVEQRLRLHEVERYGASRVSSAQVDQQVEELRAGFPDEARWDARCAELGLGPEGIRLLVARQLRVLAYIEERLGPRIFVDLDEIREYYDTLFTQEMRRQESEIPPLDEVREQIRRILREERLNQEIETWTEGLRLASDIVDLFDAAGSSADLPPVIRRILP